MHATLIMCTVKERWYREFFEEIQDKISDEALGSAAILDSGMTQRGQGYLCILISHKAFEYALLASLKKDEDVLEVVKLPLSRLRQQLLPLFLEAQKVQQERQDTLPSS